MKKYLLPLCSVLLIGGLTLPWWLPSSNPEPALPPAPPALPQSLPTDPQELIELARRSPQHLQALEAQQASPAPEPAPADPSEPPKLYSELDLPEAILTDEPGPRLQDLYFWEDFASLRSEAVRDPDSPQNRATIESLARKRAQRLGHIDNE